MKTKLIIFSILAFSFLFTTPVYAQSLSQVMVQSHEVPSWGRPYGDYSVSVNSTVFFENFEPLHQKKLGTQVIAKQYQSFAGPGGRGTVYYLEFAHGTDMNKITNYAKTQIWGGSRATGAHPERILSVGNVLAIISCRNTQMAVTLEGLILR